MTYDPVWAKAYYQRRRKEIRAKQKAHYEANREGEPRRPAKPRVVTNTRGTMWRSGQFSWLNGYRQDEAWERSVADRAFRMAADEISERVFRDGAWATAIRFSNQSFINLSPA
jgi:hypothetical protein